MLEYLNELLDFLEYHNSMAPFPPYDTEYVALVRKKLEEVKNNKEDYDNLPVAACKYCNGLHIEVDDLDNDHCMKCGSINDLHIFKDIREYLDYVNKENGID